MVISIEVKDGKYQANKATEQSKCDKDDDHDVRLVDHLRELQKVASCNPDCRNKAGKVDEGERRVDDQICSLISLSAFITTCLKHL